MNKNKGKAALVSHDDFTAIERIIVDMLAEQGMSIEEAADFLFSLSNDLRSPGIKAMETVLSQPLSQIDNL